MPRYSENVYPLCRECGKALDGGTTIVVSTDSGQMFSKLQRWATTQLRCLDCEEQHTRTRPKYRRM